MLRSWHPGSTHGLALDIHERNACRVQGAQVSGLRPQFVSLFQALPEPLFPEISPLFTHTLGRAQSPLPRATHGFCK